MKLVSLAVLAMIGMSSAASAAVVAGSEQCGELPNAKWSWSITASAPVISGGETSNSTGDVTYNKPGTVGSALVTTTTAPTLSTTTVSCVAMNPQGKINTDHSTSMETTIVISEGSSTSANQVVCNPNNSGGNLPNCPL